MLYLSHSPQRIKLGTGNSYVIDCITSRKSTFACGKSMEAREGLDTLWWYLSFSSSSCPPSFWLWVPWWSFSHCSFPSCSISSHSSSASSPLPSSSHFPGFCDNATAPVGSPVSTFRLHCQIQQQQQQQQRWELSNDTKRETWGRGVNALMLIVQRMSVRAPLCELPSAVWLGVCASANPDSKPASKAMFIFITAPIPPLVSF